MIYILKHIIYFVFMVFFSALLAIPLLILSVIFWDTEFIVKGDEILAYLSKKFFNN